MLDTLKITQSKIAHFYLRKWKDGNKHPFACVMLQTVGEDSSNVRVSYSICNKVDNFNRGRAVAIAAARLQSDVTSMIVPATVEGIIKALEEIQVPNQRQFETIIFNDHQYLLHCSHLEQNLIPGALNELFPQPQKA